MNAAVHKSLRRVDTRLVIVVAVAAFVASCTSAAPTPPPTPVATPNPTPFASVIAATASPTAAPTAVHWAPTPGSSVPPSPTYMGQVGPSGQGVAVTIVAAGDIACDPAKNVGQPADCDQAATANLIGQLNPTAVLTMGDTQYEDGTLAAYKAVYDPTWGAYREITYPAVGNHEYLTKGAAGYFEYFGFPAYYSYDLGGWHMIALDSECSYIGGCTAGSAEVAWLLADLAAHPSQCTLAYWHEPRWSSGEHGDAKQMATIWADLASAHVSVVLTGHNHDYERFVPLSASGVPDPAGPTEFVVGTGGKNHYGFSDAPLTGEVVRNDKSFGLLQMTLRPTGYSWEFVDAPTYTFHDSGSASCV